MANKPKTTASKNEVNTDPVELNGWISPGYKNVQLNYILYLASIIFGITAIVGLVFAYVNRNEDDGNLYSHYTYQIRTFWIGLLYFIASMILMFFIIGFILMIAVGIWWIVRSIKGLMAASNSQPIANPDSWLI